MIKVMNPQKLIAPKKLWLTFPVLVPSRSGNMAPRNIHSLNKTCSEWPTVVKKLTINDKCSHCPIWATCYQLAQTVLKIGSVLAESVG